MELIACTLLDEGDLWVLGDVRSWDTRECGDGFAFLPLGGRMHTEKGEKLTDFPEGWAVLELKEYWDENSAFLLVDTDDFLRAFEGGKNYVGPHVHRSLRHLFGPKTLP